MHPLVALKRGHLPRPLFFRFQQLSLLRAMLLHLDLGSSHNTPALQPLSSVLCRSGAESFQPGRRPRTPESRDPGGRRATEGSARLTPVVDRLKTEKTVLSLRAQCGPIACAAQCNGQHARYGHRHLNPAGHGRSAKRAPNADGLDSWTKSLDRPSCHQSPHGHLQSANACAPRQYSNIGVASEWLRILGRGSVA